MSLNDLRDKLEKSAHEYLVAMSLQSTTFPMGFGNIQIKFKLNCENGRPTFFTNTQTIEKTHKP